MDAIDLTEEDQPADSADVEALEVQLVSVEAELHELEEEMAAMRSRQQQLRQLKEQLQMRISTEKRAPRADWPNTHFEWNSQLQQALQSVFGLQAFRPLQREVINATLHGRDVLLLLPSGGGKSLCYQLPALISGGVTLVVSPLLSLIVDQVMGLSGRVQAYALTSLTSKEGAAQVMAALTAAASSKAAAGSNKGSSSAGAAAAAAAGDGGGSSQPLLLYVTPEKIVASKRLMAKLEKLHQAGRLMRIAIDEAHCCSTWGNDFRPDYKKLGVLKQQFPDTPIIALTATATMQVCRDIKSILRIEGAEQFTASINRPNLRYEVRHKPASAEAAAQDICDWIAEHGSRQSGIVYCLTRKDCEVLASQLVAAGLTAAHYHADMEPAARQAAHSSWSSGAVQVMVATVAFGMGINKPDVRWVLHACLSKSLENYYQESGRAGRDGQPARCVLCYRLSDVLRQASVVCMEPTWQRNLMAVTGYAAATSGCRRAALAAHFSEPPPPCNGICDLCAAYTHTAAAADAAGVSRATAQQQQQQQRQQQQRDITAEALCAIAALKDRKGEKRATLNQLLDDLPRAAKKAAAAGSSMRSSSSSRMEHEWVVEQLLLRGLLGLEFGFTAYATNTYLVVTAAGEAFCSGQGKQRLVSVCPSWLGAPSAVPGQHPGAPAAMTSKAHPKKQQPRQQEMNADDALGNDDGGSFDGDGNSEEDFQPSKKSRGR
ncbi:hypothetical protein OEZ85_010299 [Tetradesmus obliquus]|uniref:ATP-dependent DNA helicase n=1 Tax=Tetradesmus obliquus TaxID=3088 RepID=A0ABY8TM88_TETOB|nr:hypothetical protein OEZ85_010299 [Tetradesmus obliquus]